MNVQQIATRLMQDEVVAYPTEAVFGLGCNPLSESAVRKLLNLKQRPIEKGLILVAPSLHFLQPFVDFSHLSDEQLARLQEQYEHPITWVVPVVKADSSLARYTAMPAISSGVPRRPLGWRARKLA